MIQIAIADDHQLFRKSFILLLQCIPNIKVALEVSNGQELLDGLNKKQIDLVLLDLQMPFLNGFETAEHINTHYPKLPILILSVLNDLDSLQKILKFKISGYLSKNASIDDLQLAIELVTNGGYFFEKGIIKLIDIINQTKDNRSIIITERELEIIQLYACEYNSKQIAQQLSLSWRTIDKHKENLIDKTNSKSFVGVLIYALKNNLINFDNTL